MRIQTLEIENFMPYRSPVSLDFRDLSLFAIVGETGSGKSSVVDAICYALYGRIPRIRTETGQRESVISRGAKQFHVALTFELGGATYRVVRQGTVTREDVQIFRDGELLSHLVKKKDADRYIEDTLLHMSFDVFTRIIVLPQGQFDRFLKPDTPRARRDILISLLNLDIYERIGKAAGTRANILVGELSGLEHDLAGLDPATFSDEALAAAQRAVADAATRAKLLQEQLKTSELTLAVMEQRVAKHQELVRLRQHMAELAAQSARVDADRNRLATGRILASLQPMLTSWERLAAQRTTLGERYAAAGEAVQAARKAVNAASEEYADLERRSGIGAFTEKLSGIAADIGRLSDLQPYAARLEELRHRTDAAATKISQLERASDEIARSADTMALQRERLQQELERSRDAVAQADDTYEKARSDNAAVVVQQGLAPGDTCPVCGHVIERLTAHVEHDDLARLRTARDEARAAVERCQAVLAEHDKKAETGRARKESLDRQLAELHDDRTADEREAHELTLRLLMDPNVARDGKDDPTSFLRSRLAQLRSQETTIRTAQQALSAKIMECRQRGDTARMTLSEAESAAAALDGQLRQVTDQHESTQRDLLAQAASHGFDSIEAMRAALLLADELEALQSSVREYDRDAAAVAGQVKLLERELGDTVPSEANLATLRAERDKVAAEAAGVQDELTTAQRSKDEMTTRQAFHADRQKRKNEVTRLLSTYQQVARDFGSKGMVAFVSGGILEQLLIAANDHLGLLSKGRYGLLLDETDQMLVQDSFSASGPRDVATLSGGETFLASLALALAVKDLLSVNVHLDSFFIDEGFGTLDENSVQGVADVLESLRRDGSLIGIITHRADLVERFEAVLEVTSQGGSAVIARREAV